MDCGSINSSKYFTLLGIRFFNGELSEAIKLIKRGGLLTAPSGPGLAQDLPNSPEYERALSRSDLILADSGLLSLWAKFFEQTNLKRISGLVFLEAFLNRGNLDGKSSFWVMPDMKQAAQNVWWLKNEFNIGIPESNIYVAPVYTSTGALEDFSLLKSIEKKKPKYIFIQIGGGVQERLGHFIKASLSYSPSIICTGAAIAFLSGCQKRIPRWVDNLFLGWLWRCIDNPKIFIPRYLRAFNLVFLLCKYRNKSPREK